MSSFRAKKFKPRRANGAKGLIFTPVWRCDTCGSQHKEKPVQCLCGCITFTKFDSKAEAARWATLLLYEKTGRIENLRRQVRIQLNATGPSGLAEKIGVAVIDFEYDQDGKRVLEDVKGLITDLAKWKFRHIKTQYGIPVLLTKGK